MLEGDRVRYVGPDNIGSSQLKSGMTGTVIAYHNEFAYVLWDSFVDGHNMHGNFHREGCEWGVWISDLITIVDERDSFDVDESAFEKYIGTFLS